jgi:NADH-quinone oxidoreductase subunit L
LNDLVNILWLVPVLPLLAATILALMPGLPKKISAGVAIGALGLSFLISAASFFATLSPSEGVFREVVNITWFQMGVSDLKIGWILDPLSAIMLVMVTFVGALIFLFSSGYMSSDERFTRFFCYLSLFAAAMLGIIISNSLLLLFICWELVGVASYLLIGFWAHKPSATAAAKKAFITTRIGDIGFFIGMLWLYSSSGTLLFFDNGNGCLESGALSSLGAQITVFGLALSTGITLLIFWGAMGKSGQFPLHVWLPDAMEGPTPVSALIHAATMVAAGVFLMARLYPLMGASISEPVPHEAILSGSLIAMTWIGSITALFGALVAVAQTDIKRILAYSTVSQLGYMMLGLGTGGPAVAMFHLITHAFFKALLFLGAGSVIHGCHDIQDIRRMGGLKKAMPITFATYAIGMLALSGFPLLFSGFWSKDAILHSAHSWSPSHLPFFIALIGAFLTAFYMTRQMCYVFFGKNRLNDSGQSKGQKIIPHESPAIMTWPLIILAVGAIALGFLGTPAFPAFQSYLDGTPSTFSFAELYKGGSFLVMILSSVIALGGIVAGWWFYRSESFQAGKQKDPIHAMFPRFFSAASNRFGVDEFYQATILRATSGSAKAADLLDKLVIHRVVIFFSLIVKAVSWTTRFTDEHLVNGLFDQGCKGVRLSARGASRIQSGQIQSYLKIVGSSLVILALFIVWISRS